MEIRRKVFSLLQNENGEEKLFSTNEFELQEQENEKLFSTGDPELDDILEEVYYSGLEDGYDYFEYEQREFGRRKWNQRNNIANSQIQAAGKSAELLDNAGRFAKIAPEIKEKYNGDIDKWLESLKKEGRHNEFKKYNGMFKTGAQREGLEQVLKGIDPSKTEIVEKAARSAETAVERGADATAAYGKTRQSVQTGAGNTFETGGKKVNAKLDNAGSATVTTQAGKLEGERYTKTQSKSNKRRADVANQERSIPENNTKLGKKRRGSVPSKFKTKKNPSVIQGEIRDVVDTESLGKNKSTFSTIKGGKVDNAQSFNNIKDTKGNVFGMKGETQISNGITSTTRKTGRKSLLEKAGKWAKNNKGKAVLIGTGLVATGVGTGIAAKNNKNKRGSARA